MLSENAIGLKDIASDELHLHFVGRREIPDAPEFRQFCGFAESDADVVIERRKWAADLDTVLFEVFDDFGGGPLRVQHAAIGVGIDDAKHARVGLIEKFLTV